MDPLALLSAGAQAEIEKRDAALRTINTIMVALMHDLCNVGDSYFLPTAHIRRTVKAGCGVDIQNVRGGISLTAVLAPKEQPAKEEKPAKRGKKQPEKDVG